MMILYVHNALRVSASIALHYKSMRCVHVKYYVRCVVVHASLFDTSCTAAAVIIYRECVACIGVLTGHIVR